MCTPASCSQDVSELQSYQLIVDGLFTSDTNSQFSITIQNFLSPPTADSPLDPITVTTLDSNSFKLDIGSYTLTGLNPITPTVISSITSGIVRESSQGFSMNFSLPVATSLVDTV